MLQLEAALSELPKTEADLEELRHLVQLDRIAPRTLVSVDERAFAINIVLEPGAERHYDGILADVRSRIETETAWVSGVPVFRMEADSRTRQELLTFVPLTVILVGLLLFLIFRSTRAVVIPLATAGVGCWATAGMMGATGVPITIATVLLPSILLALGCAYSMHLLNAGAGHTGADLEDALRPVALPVALSGLTTAVGFIAISSVRIDAIRDIGTYGALGVLVVLASTLTAVPALLKVMPVPARTHRLRTWLEEVAPPAISQLVGKRGAQLGAIWLIALVGMGVGIGRISIDTDVIRWFPKQDPIRLAYEEIRTRLSGISPMNVVIDAEDGATVSSEAAIRAIDRLVRDLEATAQVGRAISIADPLRQIHGGFTEDPTNPIPSGDSLIEQYLLLLDAKPYTRDLITGDRTSANVMMRIDDNGSDALLRVRDRVDELWSQYGFEGGSARTTGIMYEFARAEDEIARGQLLGLAIAFTAIGVILLAIFGDLKIAVIALIPNAIPIGMAFGLMGLVGVPLDAGTVILGSLALGVAVDDTIHLTDGFVRARAFGDEPEKAVLRSLTRVLPPLAYTTLAVALGFAVLAVSDFTLTRNLGILTSGVMLLCLAADLLLLPVLLIRVSRAPESKKGV
jgi:predicted RND superfamily exporter protein